MNISKEELHEIIKEYIKENLEIYVGYEDSFTVKVKLKFINDSFPFSYAYICIPESGP